jgi:hypothetical protein
MPATVGATVEASSCGENGDQRRPPELRSNPPVTVKTADDYSSGVLVKRRE